MTIIISSQAVAVQAGQVAPAVQINSDRHHQVVVSEDSVKWRRNPFIKSDSKKTAPTGPIVMPGKKTTTGSSTPHEINLQGIMQADKAFHALINGRIYKAGDKLGGLNIIEISRYRVVLQNNLKETSIYDIHKGKINRGEK